MNKKSPIPRPITKALEPTETEFTNSVIDLAHLYRWVIVHFRPARTEKGWATAVQGDGVGWPDLFAVRGTRLIAAELKTRDNRLTSAQKIWLGLLETAGVETYCWRPRDWDSIVETFK